MKKLLLIISLLFAIPVKAITFDVLVLPSDLLSEKENYYGFEEVSEIVAKDIIENFNTSEGKIKSPDLYTVKVKLNQDTELKQTVEDALNKYKNSGTIDYSSFKKAGDSFECKSVLIVSSYTVTNKNSLKRSVWEILDISSALDISYPFRLETSVVLLDNVNNLVMWSNNYSAKLGANDNLFEAQNFAQAAEQLEKIRTYSKNIVAPSASQNITLRFFPKTIRPVETDVKEIPGGALRYEKNIPELPQKPKLRENYYGDMIYGI